MPDRATSRPGWDDVENAEQYAAFTRQYPMYADTSQDLVRLADIGDAERVVDLACGTGATTEAILEVVPQTAEVIAVDGSAAMLAVGRHEVTDARVQWIHSRAENLDTTVPPASVDAVICNSAFWQTDMPATCAAVHNVLRPGGRLAFNIGGQFLTIPPTDDEQPRSSPSLFELMHAVAVLDYGFVRPTALRNRPPLTSERIQEMLERTGFEVVSTEFLEYADSPERQRAWLSIPIFSANNGFGVLTYEQRMDALAKAYERLDKSARMTARWLAAVATKRV